MPLEMNLLRRCVLGDGLRRTAQRNPGKQALIYYHTDGRTVTYSYQELNEKVNRLANSLINMGVRKGDKVAVISHNSNQLVCLIYALFKIGAWYTPLNFMLGSKEIEYIINFSEAKIFFVEDELVKKVQEVQENLSTVEHFGYINVSEKTGPEGWLNLDILMNFDSDKEPEIEIEDEDVATLMFTSGTEAAPKGVLTTHRNYYASHMAYIVNARFSPDDVFLISIPLIHMAGMDLILATHLNGATVVMTQIPIPDQMVDLIPKYKITSTANPPTLYVAMTNVPGFKERDFGSVKKFITWASTMPQAMVETWGEVAPNLEWFTIQGSSESTATALTGSWFKKWDDVPDKDGTWVGKTMAVSSELKLVDDNDNEVLVGEIGEQVVRGPVVMKGYYKNEEATQKAFRGGWFHTGDLLRMDSSGNFYFVDRKKDMIKSGGENVSSQEVENVVSSHPKVLQCAVFGVPHDYWGEAVAVAIVPKPGQELVDAEVLDCCKEKLAGYKVPKFVVFRNSLPTSAAGKLYKRELRDIYKNIAKS